MAVKPDANQKKLERELKKARAALEKAEERLEKEKARTSAAMSGFLQPTPSSGLRLPPAGQLPPPSRSLA